MRAIESTVKVNAESLQTVQALNALAQDCENVLTEAETAAHAYRRAQEEIRCLLAQDPEPRTLQTRIQERASAFTELQEGLRDLATNGTRNAMNEMKTAIEAWSTTIESVGRKLEHATGVALPTVAVPLADSCLTRDEAILPQFWSSVEGTNAELKDKAWSLSSLRDKVLDCLRANNEAGMLAAASQLRSRCHEVLMMTGDTDGLLSILSVEPHWLVLVRRLHWLQAIFVDLIGLVASVERRAESLESLVQNTTNALEMRKQLVSSLEASHKALKSARKKLKEFWNEQDSSDEEDNVDRADELLQKKRDCRAAIRTRDDAARELITNAQAHYPEELLAQKKRLESSGLSLAWSERTLADYDICRKLVSNGNGRHTVYLAKYGNDMCVLKAFDKDRDHTICREAKVLRQLKHPHIVSLVAVFVDREKFDLYLHMPYAKHGDLGAFLQHQSALANHERIGVSTIRLLSRQLCEALAYLAEQGVVHCDVKPTNIFVDSDDGCANVRAILGDFDVSRTASGRTASLTTALHLYFSSGYAAPELVHCPVDSITPPSHKLDIFGLGCVVFHMHMYPRTLPHPRHAHDSVAEPEEMFDVEALEAGVKVAVPSWAEAVPRQVVRNATRADAEARPTAVSLLQLDYLRLAGDVMLDGLLHTPAYWVNESPVDSVLVPESEDICRAIEALMNATAQPAGDARRFRVLRVDRVENQRLWGLYAAHRYAKGTALDREKYAPVYGRKQPLTKSFVYPLQSGSLDTKAGEYFLFHGTPRANSIVTSGFDVRYAYNGSGARALFGKGLYFAESAAKAATYSRTTTAGHSLQMILARVTLGRCKVVNTLRQDEPFLPLVPHLNTPNTPVYYDSILVEMQTRCFREIVVGESVGTYPEFVVEYTPV
jgi:serine/threonine protein kinase